MQQNKAPDLLDDSVAFLAKREGIDKTLKIIRYATRLLLATALHGDGELATRLGRFESSIGTSRWVRRLLAGAQQCQRQPLSRPD